MTRPVGRVRVLDHDPALGEGLDSVAFSQAREACVAPVVVLGTGPVWAGPLSPDAAGGSFGYLVLQGVLVERLVVAGDQSTAELLLPGDVVRPWPSEAGFSDLLVESSWGMAEAGSLALLDAGFLARASRWPQLLGALGERADRRQHGLAFRLAIAQIRRLDVRIRLVLWLLADRAGIVDREGVFVPVRINRRVLGEVVSARRPSVSRTLAGLEEEGLVEVTGAGFRLRGGPPEALAGQPVRPLAS